MDKEVLLRKAALEETIVKKGGLTFHDIAGLHDAKEALTEAFIMPLQFPHLFTGIGSNQFFMTLEVGMQSCGYFVTVILNLTLSTEFEKSLHDEPLQFSAI